MNRVFFLLTIVLLTTAVHSQDRTLHALVVGCDYDGTRFQLPSPVRDAERISEALAAAPIGFKVTILKNPDRRTFLEAVDAFGEVLEQDKGIGLFYFSGHGMQHEGENYLMPAGASPAYREDLPTDCIAASRIVVRMTAAGNGTNLLFLDACRDSPLPSARAKSAALPGLAQMSGSGLLIGFAADSGRTALDSGKGSRYTNALLKHLPTPGISVAELLTRVRRDVIAETGQAQEPFVYMGLDELFAFVPGGVDSMTNAEMVKLREELAAAREKLAAADGNVSEMARLQRELDKTKAKMAAVSIRAFPANNKMEGTRAGEERELGGIKMVWCPAGEFLMGSPASEDGRNDDETQHRVTLTKGFWLAKTETTHAQWEGVMGTRLVELKLSDDAQLEVKEQFIGDKAVDHTTRALHFVSWYDAQEFLKKLNNQHPLPSGWNWDLPSEAQWEYACRAGTTTRYAGNLDELAWYEENSGGKAKPVGTKKANKWGLQDMHGNLWEWCADYYGGYKSEPATDPEGPISGSPRVYRGASWGFPAVACRSAFRSGNSPDYVNLDSGFRIAAVPSDR